MSSDSMPEPVDLCQSITPEDMAILAKLLRILEFAMELQNIDPMYTPFAEPVEDVMMSGSRPVIEACQRLIHQDSFWSQLDNELTIPVQLQQIIHTMNKADVRNHIREIVCQ